MKLPARPRPFPLLFDEAAQGGRLPGLLDPARGIEATVGDRYYHWHTLRRLDPPGGLTAEDWWLAVKVARQSPRRSLPLLDRAGRPFSYTRPDPLLRMLRRVDLHMGGQVSLPEEVTSGEERDRYIISSLVEEAITSSQLEGAATTRPVAKRMIREGRAPRTEGERMILNNYLTMQRVREVVGEPLTPALVLELHRRVTEGTLAPERQGLRRPGAEGHDVGVYSGQTLLHRPPPAEELPGRLERMCAFANDPEPPEGSFFHPALRAVALHFWLAYDHPFVDGNGRTARALFYWSMLRQGFWLAQYLSVSRVLKEAPARYGRAFLYTETDDNDLTYFFLFHLRVIERALDELQAYLQRKVAETRETKALLASASGLNHRQVALLTHALRHPGQAYTIRSHQSSHGVVYQTARTDLLGLAERGLLAKAKAPGQGGAFVFTAVPGLSDRLRSL